MTKITWTNIEQQALSHGMNAVVSSARRVTYHLTDLETYFQYLSRIKWTSRILRLENSVFLGVIWELYGSFGSQVIYMLHMSAKLLKNRNESLNLNLNKKYYYMIEKAIRIQSGNPFCGSSKIWSVQISKLPIHPDSR